MLRPGSWQRCLPAPLSACALLLVFFWLELSLISCRATGTILGLLQGKILGRILLRLTGRISHRIFYFLRPLANSHFCVVVDFVCLLSQHFVLQSLFIPTFLPARGAISRCHKLPALADTERYNQEAFSCNFISNYPSLITKGGFCCCLELTDSAYKGYKTL